MRTHRSVAGLLVVGLSVALGVAGCVIDVTFSPLGNDVSVEGAWSINGAPATAAACSGAGISTVGMVFFDAGTEYRYDAFRFPCEQGSFDTRPDLVLALGQYTTQWRAYAASGTEVARGGMIPLNTSTLAIGSHVILAPVDFVTSGFNPLGTDASLSAEWQINGATPSTTNCAAAGIANVSIKLYAQSDTAYAAGVEVARDTCASGKFMSEPMRILRAGTYLTSIDALDASGAVVGSYKSPSVLVVMAGVNQMLMVANFTTAPAGESLDVTIRWDTTVGPTMTDADCATAGVATMTYTLMGPGGTVVNMMSDIACGAGVTFPDTLIAPGIYSIYVEGADAAGAKNWMVTCPGLDVMLNEHAMYSCFVDKVM